jgi:hypothetical protein
MISLSEKLETALHVRPTEEQMANIELFVKYAVSMNKPSTDPTAKAKEDFLIQLNGHLQKVIRSLELAPETLGKDYHWLQTLFYVSDVAKNDSMKFDNYAVTIRTITDETVTLTKTKEDECFKYLLKNLNDLSSCVQTAINTMQSVKKKGKQIDEWLVFLIERLAFTFFEITGLEPKRSWNIYRDVDDGPFLRFVRVVLDHYGIEPNGSVPNAVRKVVTTHMA